MKKLLAALFLVSRIFGCASNCGGLDNSSFQYSVLGVVSNSSGSECESCSNSHDAAALVRQAIEVAMEDINGKLDLHGLLQLTTREIECSRRGGLDAFFPENQEEQQSWTGVVGTSCSDATEAIGEVSHYFNTITISYTPITKQGRDQFTHLFSVVPSVESLAPGIAAFVSHFNWNRTTIITQEENIFSCTARALVRELKAWNSSHMIEQVFFHSYDEKSDLQFFTPNIRVVVINTYPSYAKLIFCTAMKEQYSGYVWLIPGWYPEKWWRAGSDVNCTTSDIEKYLASERVIAISQLPNTTTSEETVNGSSRSQFTSEYNRRLDETSGVYSAHYAYDAMWTLALAVNQSYHVMSCSPNTSSLKCGNETFGYSQMNVAALTESISMLQFSGVSGDVSFQDGIRPVEEWRVMQYRRKFNDSETKLAKVGFIKAHGTSKGKFVYEDSENDSTLWADGVPSDGSPIKEYKYPILLLTVVCYLLSASCSIFAVVCLVFNFKYREKKIIRLTSPNLNYVIGFGAILFNTAPYFFLYPEISQNSLEVFCNLRLWLAAVGYSLCFGTINAKMWRVYYIFHSPSTSKKVIKDWHIAMIAASFVTIDILILTVVTSFDEARFKPVVAPDKEYQSSKDENGVEINYCVYLCGSQWRTVWLAGIFGYKFILQIIGIFLAFKIRKVEIKVLNDSKEVSFILYISSIILVTVVIISLAFQDYLNVYGAAYGFGITICDFVVLGFVFIPKMVGLYSDPTGKRIFGITHADPSVVAATIDSQIADKKITDLRSEIKTLKRKLATYEANSPTSTQNNAIQMDDLDDSMEI